jgi:hypothetical protein
LLSQYSAKAHSPTWTDAIACIVYTHCSSCHNQNGIAPFPLMTYNDVFQNRFSIAASVQANSMPPFPANQEKRKYEELNMENIKLNNKVAVGAKLNTESIVVVGIKARTSGKERETNRASQTEKLKITFTIKENYVADIGNKIIYVKIYGVDGTTIYNEASGSGVFQFEGTESLYSTKKEIEYTQVQQMVNVYWDKGTEFAKGKYKVDLFCEGLRIGTTDFELK